MQCERARELLSPYLDGELSAEERRAIATHVEGCRVCSAQATDFRRIGRTLSEAGREPAPKALALRVRANLAREVETEARRIDPAIVKPSSGKPAIAKSVAARPAFRMRALMQQAAAIAVACVLSALATWWIVGTAGEASRLEQEVLAAHVRSLLQDSPIQVASSDAHTVKPWFAGRVDFSPEVKDLATDGFPLLGGRLDYVGGRRVGAVVYKRRLHTIDVFIWPSASSGDTAPSLVTRNGYNLLAWTRAGAAYWAVSDLNAGDLRQLQSLL
jgi:anti-sigma factor RsiW